MLNYNSLIFSILNLISGFCEIGVVVWGMKTFGIIGALVGVFCYQLGNLVPNPIQLSKRICLILLSVSAIFGLTGIIMPVFLYPAVTGLTMVLQNERSVFKNKSENTGSKVGKRLLRIFGFACGFGYGVMSFFVCLVFVTFCLIYREGNCKTKIEFPLFNKLDITLILHEIHYFVYCYCILLIVYRLNACGKSVGGFASCAFALSWVLYTFVPNIYKSPNILNKLGYKKTFLIGHLILTVILAVMFIASYLEKGSESFPIFTLVIWFLTGIGGTTEFCIGEIDKLNGTYIKNNHNSAENLGHILGVMLSIIVYLVTCDLYISILIAGVFALMAMLFMFVFVKECKIKTAKIACYRRNQNESM